MGLDAAQWPAYDTFVWIDPCQVRSGAGCLFPVRQETHDLERRVAPARCMWPRRVAAIPVSDNLRPSGSDGGMLHREGRKRTICSADFLCVLISITLSPAAGSQGLGAKRQAAGHHRQRRNYGACRSCRSIAAWRGAVPLSNRTDAAASMILPCPSRLPTAASVRSPKTLSPQHCCTTNCSKEAG